MDIKKEDFYRYIESHVGVPINDNTLFFEEIGIDGVDAITLMEDISKAFKIDMSAYNYENYHVSEADIANILKTLWRFLFFRKKLNKKTFSAQHLYEVVKEGVWFSPVVLKM